MNYRNNKEKVTKTEIEMLLNQLQLISQEDLTLLLDKIIVTMKSIDMNIRPRDKNGNPGGIVRLRRDLPTVIVPDIHGRTGLISALINFEYGNGNVFDLLVAGKIQILFLGDAFHTELKCQTHWVNAYLEYENGYIRHETMDLEMTRNFNVLQAIVLLKLSFPDYVFFLKGNHENILNENKDGNYPFGKYVHEGEMVRKWMLKFYGESTVNLLSRYEKLLPLLAIGKNFLASHAEPLTDYSEERIINYRKDPDVIYGLTWTSNDRAEQGSVRKLLKKFIKNDLDNAVYFGGHRIIDGKFKLRNGNKFIQIHNPGVYQAVFFNPDRTFDPEIDIINMERE